MQLHFSPSMGSITISSSSFSSFSSTNNNTNNNGEGGRGSKDLMKIKVAPRHISYRVNNCSSIDCLGRRLGPKLLGRTDNGRLVKDLAKIMNQVNSEKVPDGIKLPNSFTQLVSEMKNNKYSSKDFALILKGMMDRYERQIKETKYAELMNRHFAASSVSRGIHCLSLKLTDEYSSNAHARKQLPSPEMLPLLSDNSYYHFVLSTDNILAASVVVRSAVQSSSRPDKIVFHVITDKKTYAGMHTWENVPVLEAVENHNGIRSYYHGNHIDGANLSDISPRMFASRLQARNPKYISLLNHLRIYLPELFPNLDKVVFLDDDIVIQRDLSPLWKIDLTGKVNGAVETCKDECAWAYGMNIFDLRAWRKTNIRETYHSWVKENIKSNLTLWKLGTLPPALIAFKGHVHPIEPSWHMLGLGYQNNTNIENLKSAAVIHYNGQSKPWLDVGFQHLRPYWTKYVNYSNDFIRSCHILE